MDSGKFSDTINEVLSPSRAITSPEFLRGRNAKMSSVSRALSVEGRQVFIYGLRGVGKTSLALSCANEFLGEDDKPVHVICSESDDFYSIVHSACKKLLPTDPDLIRKSLKTGGTLTSPWVKIAGEAYIEKGQLPRPETFSDALDLVKFCSNLKETPDICIIDEFEALTNKTVSSDFARFLKGVADLGIGTKFVFCGIADSVHDLFVSHGSAHRYLHTEELERLGWDARLEISKFAGEKLGINIDRSTQIRIASISDGFPYFVHELTSKVLWACFDRGYQSGMVTNANDFVVASHTAIQGIELEFKPPYELAVQKYKTDGEVILWALADTHELKRNLSDIHSSYSRICRELEITPLTKSQLSARLSRFKTDKHEKIVMSDRRAWYEFTQKMMRGYARLRAAKSNIHLDPDHPLG